MFLTASKIHAFDGTQQPRWGCKWCYKALPGRLCGPVDTHPVCLDRNKPSIYNVKYNV